MPEALQQAEVVPAGERDELRRTAQETGERFGRQDAVIASHDDHFGRINGSIDRMSLTLGDQATSLALLTAAISSIERTLAHREEATARKEGWSVQVWIGLVAAILTMLGIAVTIVLVLIGILVKVWIG